MTLRELMKTSWNCVRLSADVRDPDGKLLEVHEVGRGLHEYKIHGINIFFYKKPINHMDSGKDYVGVILKNIPQELLDLEVTMITVNSSGRLDSREHWRVWLEQRQVKMDAV